jgi:2-dehydropantoate 2-reductase
MKTKIIVAGIGGVGGYFGGLLAKHFYNSENVEINFVARGAHLKEIQNNGLKVIQGDDEFIVWPTLATDNPSEIGIANFIIVATKSYDLESVLEQLRPCINLNTIILPLLNGVDSRERIQTLLPDTVVLDGCVYIVARLKQAGIVENIGNIQTLYFGLDNYTSERLLLLESLFKEAGIEATLSQNISTVLWEKFIFISPTATATSYFNNSIGEVLADPEKLSIVAALIEEIKQVAKTRGVIVPEDITEKTWNKLKGMPFGATSSMHNDFKNNKPNNELESLTGYVIREGKTYGIATPTYEMAYAALEKKSGQINT